MEPKRLYKSKNRKIFGVCGGIAEYFNVDPTVVRIIALILVFCGIGCPIIIYLILALAMPENNSSEENQHVYHSDDDLKNAKKDD